MNKISVTPYYIQIIADANDSDFAALLLSVKGIEKTRSNNTYRCSLHLLPEVLLALRNIDCASQLSGEMQRFYMEEVNRRDQTSELKRLGPQRTSTFLWPHQQLGVELAEVNHRYNFFYDTRTGKTLMALQIMYDSLKSGKAKRCVVFCPSSIISSWIADAAKYFPELKVVAYYGDAKEKQEALHKPCHIVVWSTGMVLNTKEMIQAIDFDLCFFDESSKLKSYKAELSKAAIEISQHIPRWYNLSATPAPNGEHEYYIQMRTVDPYSFNSARTHFVSKYFDDTSRNKNYEKLVIKEDMKPEFMKRIEDYSIYVDQSVMPTAGKEWHTVDFDLGEDTWQAYIKMATEMYTEIAGTSIVATIKPAVRAKLNQLTSGFVLSTEAIKENEANRVLKIYDADLLQESFRTASCEKLRTFEHLIQSIGRTKCVIWANYTEEFRMLREYFDARGIPIRIIRGGTSKDDREASIKAFKTGTLQYLICHPLSVGLGINLTEAHNAIYYSLNDSWEAMHQSSQRICGHIKIQPHKCNYWVLMATDTINEVIYNNVMNKRDASTGILEHLRAVSLLDKRRQDD